MGQYFQGLRRKTTDQSLAKRSKNLIKKWRELLGMPATGTTNSSNNNTNSSTIPQKINNSQPHSPTENHFDGLITNQLSLNFINVLPKSHEQTALLGKRSYKQWELESESNLKKFRRDSNGSQFNHHHEYPQSISLNSDGCNSNSQNSKHHKHKRHKLGRTIKDVLPSLVFIKNPEPFVISDSISDEASMCEFPLVYQQHNKMIEPARPPRELSFKGCFSKDPVAQPLEPLPKIKKYHSTNHNSISSMLSGGESSGGIVTFQLHNSNSNLELFDGYTTTSMSLSKKATPAPPAVETPKKRSFKKLFNADAYKMTAGATCGGIKQKITSSTSRKEKTTKELLAELQSRKLLAAGLCPDDVNVLISSSSSSKSAGKRIMSTKKLQPIVPSRNKALNVIEYEIRELHRRLKPIHHAFNDNYDGENNIECTCTWREVIEVIEPVIEIGDTFKQIVQELNGHLNADTDLNNGDENDDLCAVDEPLEIFKPKTVVKSIFDLDYDLSDDPILNLKIIKSSPLTSLQKNIMKKKEKSVIKCVPLPLKAEVPVIDNQTGFKPPPIVKWECDEDPKCPARLHFNKFTVISDFHVRALHDKFISTVNGNWNGLTIDALAEPEPNIYELKYEHPDIRYEHHGLWKRVVPSYNHLIMEKLPKTFSPSETKQLNDISCKFHEIVDEDNDDCKPIKSDLTTNNGQLPSFNNLNTNNLYGTNSVKCTDFKEWYELINVPSYNDSEILTILPYVVID